MRLAHKTTLRTVCVCFSYIISLSLSELKGGKLRLYCLLDMLMTATVVVVVVVVVVQVF